nr:MAG TPA: replisome organizer [Caudoviricetes sp.]
MARYRKIDPRIWNDAKFMRIGPMGQMLFLYVLTHPNMTMLGMLRSTKEAIAFERGWDLSAYNQVFDLALTLGLIEYDTVGLIACPNFLKYNEPESITVVKSWGKIQDFLPECDLYFKYLKRAKEYCQKRGQAFENAFNEAFAEAKFEPNLEPNDLFDNEAKAEARAYQRTKNKEQISTNVDKKEKYKKEKKSSKSKIVLDKPEDVSSNQIWVDFLALRNARHAPLTETALNIIRKEAQKAGISLEQALETCCMRGWQGFKAEWYLKGQNRFQSIGPRDFEPEFRPEDYEGGLISDLMQR